MIHIEKIKRAFGKSAESYDEHGTLQREVSSRLVRDFTPVINSPKRVLDIGSGTGFTSKDAVERWPGIKIFPLDIAFPMVKRTRDSGFSKSITGDASSLPFPSESFDLVVSSLALQWGSDLEKIFSEINYVLKSDGLFTFSALIPGTLKELRHAYNLASRECTGVEARFPEFPSLDNVSNALKTAGLKIITATNERVVKSYPTAVEIMRTLKGIGATNPARPDNLPRRDVIVKTVDLYPGRNGHVDATYEVSYISCVKE